MDIQNIPEDGPGYAYYGFVSRPKKRKEKSGSIELNYRILNPNWRDPNYLILKKRAQIFSGWIDQLPQKKLRILDIGGRLQPYRLLVKDRISQYIGLDPLFEGVVDVVGIGENLPFPNESFDLAICTQVLNYTSNPFQVISEIHRILVREGCLYLSVPAIFPRYHNQRWRFMPDGLTVLLSSFSKVEIIPEGYSIASLLRVINLFFDTFVKRGKKKKFIKTIIYPITNIIGLHFDRFSHGDSRFTSNYSCRAHK